MSVKVTLTNNQSSPVAAGTQILLVVNWANYATSLAPDVGNVRFYDSSGNEMYGWVESGASYVATSSNVWLKLNKSIAANSSDYVTMTFLSTSTEYDGVYWGQAPQLSATYGQYDNGANVFEFYDNFAGTALNAQWTVSGITYTVDNGFSATATAPEGFIISKKLALNPGQNILDFYGINFQSNTDWTFVGMLDGGETGGTSGSGLGSGIVAGSPNASQTNGWQRNSTALSTSAAMQTARAPAIWTVEPISSTSTNFYINYGGVQTVSADADTYPLYEGLIAAGANATSYTFSEAVTITWFRVRVYPPDGAMPSVSFPPIQPTPPSALPSGITSWRQVTIANGQSTATPSNFQQMVSTNMSPFSNIAASNLQNVEFFYSDGTVIPSWLESGSNTTTATWWLLIANSIPANSLLVIYMGFASTSTNLFDGVTVGEAPQLSSTYGQYDNGAKIFNFYDNFAGTALSSKWTTGGNYTGSVDNGLTLTSSADSGGIYASYSATSGVIETYWEQTTAQTFKVIFLNQLSIGTGWYADGYNSKQVAGQTTDQNLLEKQVNGGTTVLTTGLPETNLSTYYVVGLEWNGANGLLNETLNYNSISSATDTTYTSMVGISLMTWVDATNIIKWVRARAYPPGGTMPSTSVNPASIISGALITAVPQTTGLPTVSGTTNSVGQAVLPLVATSKYNLQFSGPAIGKVSSFIPATTSFTLYRCLNRGFDSVVIDGQSVKQNSTPYLIAQKHSIKPKAGIPFKLWLPVNLFANPVASATEFIQRSSDVSIQKMQTGMLLGGGSIGTISNASASSKEMELNLGTYTYSLAANRWNFATGIAPASNKGQKLYGGTALKDGAFYMYGGVSYAGKKPTSSLGIYSFPLNTWRKGATGHPRGSGAAGFIGEKMYITDGASRSRVSGSSGGVIRLTSAYDPSTNTWSTRASDIGHLRVGCKATVIDSLMYVVGGTANSFSSKTWKSNHAYDASTNTWASKASALIAAYAHAVVDANGTLYRLQGSIAGGRQTSNLSAYDPAANSWTSKAKATKATLHTYAAFSGGSIILAVGQRHPVTAEITTEVYDPATNTWRSVANSTYALNVGYYAALP